MQSIETSISYIPDHRTPSGSWQPVPYHTGKDRSNSKGIDQKETYHKSSISRRIHHAHQSGRERSKEKEVKCHQKL